MKFRPLLMGLVVASAAVLAASIFTTQTPLRPAITAPRPDPAQQSFVVTKPLASAEAPNSCQGLYRLVCQKKGVTRDPTGVVRPDVDGELLALRTYEEIIRAHSGWTSEQVDDELVRQIYTAPNRDRIETAFRWVRRSMEHFVDGQPKSIFTQREKKRLRSILRKTELQLPPPVSVYEDEPDLLTKNDVFYERTADGKTRLRVGGAYFFTAKSWFNIIFTLGHELAHSIDPCEVRSMRMSFPAYDRLAACFLVTGVIAARKGRHECGANDQLSESFADWMAVQVTADALQGFAAEFHGAQLLNATVNAVRDLCEQDDTSSLGEELDTEFHPAPEVRIDKIFGRNPGIRELLGCAQADRAIAAEHPADIVCDFNFQISDIKHLPTGRTPGMMDSKAGPPPSK